jgi:hypothetical protein
MKEEEEEDTTTPNKRKCYTYGRLQMIYALTRTKSDVATKKMRASY